MAKPSNREKILTEGLRVVHERGFGGASVRDIVQAAGVPQGSFTNHFASKEAFGLEVLDLYYAQSCVLISATLRNDALPPLERLRAYLEFNKCRLDDEGMRYGCLFGNFTAESGDHSEAIQTRLADIFRCVQASMGYCLTAAVAAGEVAANLDCDDMAGFIVASWQGAILLGKAQRSLAPVERFLRVLFSTILPVTGRVAAA
jgi:TetR/AcrR family transcriptional repressor of nem operon